MIDLQIVGVNHADQLVRLGSETFKQAYEDVHTPEDLASYCAANFTMHSTVEDLSNPDNVCCIGSRDKQPAGYYLLKHQDCPIPLEAQSSEIKRLYVLSSEYGSGMGRTLYEHAIATVLAAGSQWFWLSVSDINLRAQKFYKKLGFESRGPGPILVIGSERLTSTIMVRRIGIARSD